jgi:hypothetical protein
VSESDVDAAMSIGMDSEYMRIASEIDRLYEQCNPDSGHGRAQRYILCKLKERIKL